MRAGPIPELGGFYERYERPLLAYFHARTRDPELAADLTAEVFASVLEHADSFDDRRPAGGNAAPWLFAIARTTLLKSFRRGRVASDARRRIGMEPLVLEDDAYARVDAIASIDPHLDDLVAALPEEQRVALLARIVEERDYGDIAAQLRLLRTRDPQARQPRAEHAAVLDSNHLEGDNTMTVLPALKDSVLEAATRRAQSAPADAHMRRVSGSRWRSPWRLATLGVGVFAAVAAALVAVLGGDASTSTAFASWSAAPTTPTSGQLQSAEAACRQQNPNVGTNEPTVADVRGPYSMLVYAGPSTITDCTADAQGTLMSSQSPSAQTPSPAQNSIKVESWGSAHTGQGGQIASVLAGRAGAGVTAVTLVLADGTNIQTTVGNGWFAAWWPGQQGVQSAKVITPSGAATQQLHLELGVPALLGVAPPA